MEPNGKKELWRAVKFTLFSISAGLIEIVSFTLLTELSGWRVPIVSDAALPR